VRDRERASEKRKRESEKEKEKFEARKFKIFKNKKFLNCESHVSEINSNYG
jgi:hypothetical protein